MMFGNRDRLIAHLMNRRIKCAGLLQELYTPLPNSVVEKLDLAARQRTKAGSSISPAVRLQDSGTRSLSECDVDL